MMTSIADAASKRRQAIRHSVPLSKAIEAYVVFLYILPTARYLHTSKFLTFPKRMLLTLQIPQFARGRLACGSETVDSVFCVLAQTRLVVAPGGPDERRTDC